MKPNHDYCWRCGCHNSELLGRQPPHSEFFQDTSILPVESQSRHLDEESSLQSPRWSQSKHKCRSPAIERELSYTITYLVTNLLAPQFRAAESLKLKGTDWDGQKPDPATTDLSDRQLMSLEHDARPYFRRSHASFNHMVGMCVSVTRIRVTVDGSAVTHSSHRRANRKPFGRV